MIFSIETLLFGMSELILLMLRNTVVNILNKYYSVGQMAIETGYKYYTAVKTVNRAWFFLSFTFCVIYVTVVLFQNRKDN